jgi:RNA methyltransferase, TrmH family
MENYIFSVKNQRIKNLKKLSEGKYRKQTGSFIVEGEKCVSEALKVTGMCTELIVFEEDEDRYADLIQADVPVLSVSKAVVNHIASSQSPQGIMCVCEKSKLNVEKTDGMVIALDGISDPGNLGAIIRSADAVGASEILLLGDCVDYLSPKVLRASMGSVFHVAIRKTDVAGLALLKDDGYVIAGADIRGNEDFDLAFEKTCIVIGNEAHGISDDVLDMVEQKIKIPIYGHAESLNAAVAASVLMYKVKGF